MLTRANVAYNFNISPHRHIISYEDGEMLEYVFSSDLYRRKFIERYEANRESIAESLTKRFNISIRNNVLADVKLYTTIEKRGFLIFKGVEKIECLNNIILDGNRVTQRS